MGVRVCAIICGSQFTFKYTNSNLHTKKNMYSYSFYHPVFLSLSIHIYKMYMDYKYNTDTDTQTYFHTSKSMLFNVCVYALPT